MASMQYMWRSCMPNSNCIVIIINTVERMRGNAVLLIVADPGGDDPDLTG